MEGSLILFKDTNNLKKILLTKILYSAHTLIQLYSISIYLKNHNYIILVSFFFLIFFIYFFVDERICISM
jgi:hypothetical protein